MKLSAVGESVKNLDKITKREFLSNYPEIPWKNVMGVRDVIVHHYFEVDAEEIFVSVKRMFHLFWIRLIGCFSIFISKL